MTKHLTIKCRLISNWNDTLVEIGSGYEIENKPYRVGTGWGNFLFIPKITNIREQGSSYGLVSYQVFNDETLEQVDLKEFNGVDLFVKVPIPDNLSERLEEVRENGNESEIDMIHKLIERINQNEV